jgi:DNA segregation ATPase FtsK/SpoIIIE-like protein
MLYAQPGKPLIRLQAPYSSEEEIQAVVNMLKQQAQPKYISLELLEHDKSAGQEVKKYDDP